jgi:hypothetical protein
LIPFAIPNLGSDMPISDIPYQYGGFVFLVKYLDPPTMLAIMMEVDILKHIFIGLNGLNISNQDGIILIEL